MKKETKKAAKKTTGKKPAKKKRAGILPSLESVKKSELREIYGYSYQAISRWDTENPAHLNTDGTCNFINLIRWREEKYKNKSGDEKRDLELEKLKKEIELKDSQIQKNLRNTMDRSLHEQILSSRAASLRSFWEKSVMKNKHRFAMKTPDEAFILLMDFITQGMEAYVRGANVEEKE